MVELSLERINANAPYQVNIVGDNGHFQFVTDFDVIYSVQFLEDDIISYNSSPIKLGQNKPKQTLNQIV